MSTYSLILGFSLLNSSQLGEAKAKPISCLSDDDMRLHCVQLFQGGKKLAISGDTFRGGPQKGGEWKIFDLTDGKCSLNGFDCGQRCLGAYGMCVSRDGTLIAVGGMRNLLFLHRTDSGNLYWDLTKEGNLGGVISHLYFTPDGKYLISTTTDMMMRVWDIENKKLHAVFRFTSDTPALNRWKSGTYVERAKHVYHMEGKYNFIGRCALAPDGKTIAVGGSTEGKVPILDLGTGKVVKTINLKRPLTSACLFTPDGKWLLANGSQLNGEKGILEIWDIEKNQVVVSLAETDRSSVRAAISPDKKTVISGGGDGFRVWDVATAKQKFSYFTKEDPRMPRVKIYPEDGRKYVEDRIGAAGVAFLPDGKTFLIAPHFAHWRTEIYFHDTATGEPVDFREAVKCLPAEKK